MKKKKIEDEDILFQNINNSKSIEKNKDEQKLNEENEKNVYHKLNKYNIKENEYPDPLKYNPNYNSIFKKIPGFKMGSGFNKNEKLKKLKNMKNKLIKDSNIKNDVKNNKNDKNKEDENILFKTNIKINKDKSKTINVNKKELSLPPILGRENNIKLKNDESKNNNHNTIISKSNNKYNKKNIRLNTLDKNSNFNILINKVVDFEKMSSRNDNFLINSNSLKTPSFGKYTPKYNFIENKIQNIKFSPFGMNKNSKKYKLYKMMRSYHIPTEYQLIDNNKLSNDKEFINQQLILYYNNNEI